MLTEMPAMLPVHLTYKEDQVFSLKLGMLIARGVPVVVKTNRVLNQWVLSELRKVPHSGIQLSIKFLDDTMRNRLERGASAISDLREMISLAKSWKIFISLSIDYLPHLVSKLDLYEMVDMVKNYTSHILIKYPAITDELFYEAKTGWEALKHGSTEKFKQYFIAQVPTRTWVVRPRYKEEITKGLSEFLRGKKITLEVLDEYEETDRIRHMASGLSDLPLGIRPFSYENVEGIFKKTDSAEGFTCPKCEKPIFA
jgi:DNA repair photolyase